MCNVSTQTVSRVINKRPDVSPETRFAVEKAISEMGYQPSALARSLVQQRSHTLGVITAGLRYVGVAQTLNGITAQCDASGYALLLKELPRFDTPNIVPTIESLMARQVDGIIFSASELNDNIKIVQLQLPPFCPPIIFLKSQPHPEHTIINIDNRGGARLAVKYLLSLGRRNIGLISGPLEWLEARARKQGWEDELQAAGLEVSDDYWVQGNWSAASGEIAFIEMLKKYPEVDAVFCSNDQMALGLLHHAHAIGKRIPEDLAVIGFDDMAEAAFFTPALTTIRQPLRELGTLAVKTLLEQVKGTDPRQFSQIITLPTELIVRDSTPQP
jgi:LacI family transcriptional regulator